MSDPAGETPEQLLDAIAAAADEPTHRSLFNRLIARFPADALAAALWPRLSRLDRPESDVVLELVESLGDPRLLDELARVLPAQTDLAPDRALLALSILDGAGMLVDPLLVEWWEELAEVSADDGAIDELAGLIEDDPDQMWVALQAIGRIEPEVRSEIVAGLTRHEVGPALAEFLRLLSFANDPATRQAALHALETQPMTAEPAARAWAEIAASHPDPGVVALAQRRLGEMPRLATSRELSPLAAPRLLRSVVTAIDGTGRGYLALLAEDAGRYVACTFLCDVTRGVTDVTGVDGPDAEALESPLDESVALDGRPVVDQAHDLALGLLSGSLLLCQDETTPALRYWLERIVGRGFRARPFAGLQGDWDPGSYPFEAVAGASRAILDRCHDWLDRSMLTFDLADSIRLREDRAGPDPARDAGAYRFLFEHRLHERLELYRRMLLWMSSFWIGAGAEELGRAALAIAWQLTDPAHAVPGHPFTVELTTRSLEEAIRVLESGVDPRAIGPAAIG